MAVVYKRSGLTGGTSTDLDEKDGASLAEADLAIVADGTDVYHYYLNATSGAAESSPDVISPDTNAGTKRWILQNVYSVTSGVNPPSGVEIIGGIAGMVLSNDTDTDHDINVTAGACMDSTGIYHILHSTEMTKRIDAAWAAGDDNGGLLNGSVAATTLYHVYCLRKDADGTADFGFLADGDAIGTYKPAGYTYYRWVGYVVTDGSSNIRNFRINNDELQFNAAYSLFNPSTTTGLENVDLSSYIPAGRVSKIHISITGGAGGNIYLSLSATENSEILESAAGVANWSDAITNDPTTGHKWIPVLADGSMYWDLNGIAADYFFLKEVKIIR